MAENKRKTRALQQCNCDRDVAGPLSDLALTNSTHFLPLLQLRNDHIEDLHDDAGRDVGHDAERKNREGTKSSTREKVEETKCTL